MVLKEDYMTNNEITFPIGYHDFHKDRGFNFQLNHWHSIGFARFEDMVFSLTRWAERPSALILNAVKKSII